MAHPLVVHCKKAKYDIYVGRPTMWGNPYIMGRNGTREMVLHSYKIWLLQNARLLGRISDLRGKVLGCWCSPLPCHADILAELANETPKTE